MQIKNDVGYGHALKKLSNCLTQDGYTDKTPATLKSTITHQDLRHRLRMPHGEFKGALWHCYYLLEDGRRPLSIFMVAVLLLVGTCLILIPSLEVFWLVTKRFLIDL
jgi:hypothetical protein